MMRGDAILTASVRDERENGWLSYKAPKGQRFAFLLLGVCDKGAENAFDVDAALNALGWHYRDSDEHRNGEDPKGLSGEAMPARAEGIAQTPPASTGNQS